MSEGPPVFTTGKNFPMETCYDMVVLRKKLSFHVM